MIPTFLFDRGDRAGSWASFFEELAARLRSGDLEPEGIASLTETNLWACSFEDLTPDDLGAEGVRADQRLELTVRFNTPNHPPPHLPSESEEPHA